MSKEEKDRRIKEIADKASSGAANILAVLTSIKEVGLAETQKRVNDLRKQGKQPYDMLDENQSDEDF